jgi:hypothetical protein
MLPIPAHSRGNASMLLNNSPADLSIAVVIIMENLESKPLMTLQQYIDAGNPLPLQQLETKMSKLHQSGIWHGDMHMNNILVQLQPSGTPRLYIIDYGRSLSGIYGNQKSYASMKGTRRYNRNMLNLIKAYGSTPLGSSSNKSSGSIRTPGYLNLGSLVKPISKTPVRARTPSFANLLRRAKPVGPEGLTRSPNTHRLRIGKKLCTSMALDKLRKYAKFAGVSQEGTKQQICERLSRLI